MKTLGTEAYDLIVTQAIERYQEMSNDEAKRAIKLEWQQQMATLFIDFLFKKRNGKPDAMRSFRQERRRKGGLYFIVPFSGKKLSHFHR